MARTFTVWTWTQAALVYARLANAQRALYSDAFETCVDNSQLTAESFNVTITPDNNTLSYDIMGRNDYTGNATFDFTVTVDSTVVYNYKEDPCSGIGGASFCPATPGELAIVSNQETTEGGFDGIPNDTYTTLNPQAYFRFALVNPTANETVGCLLANLTNDASQASASNTTEAGNDTTGDTGDMNGAGSSNSSSSPAGGSGASATYLNWTLLGCAIVALISGSFV